MMVLTKKTSLLAHFVFLVGFCLSGHGCGGTQKNSRNKKNGENCHKESALAPLKETDFEKQKEEKKKEEYLNLDEIKKLNIKQTFSNYMVQDALWVEGHPLIVNHEFDFQVAMSIPNVGAGLAVKKRKDMNQKAADKLAVMPAFDLEEAFTKDLDKDESIFKDYDLKKLGLYGFLFLGAKGRLETVLEVQESTENRADAYLPETSLRIVVVSDFIYSEDDDSWTTSGVLRDDMKKGAGLLGRIYKDFLLGKLSVSVSSSDPDEDISCPLGGSEKMKGKYVSDYEDNGMVLYKESPMTLVYCEKKQGK